MAVPLPAVYTKAVSLMLKFTNKVSKAYKIRNTCTIYESSSEMVNVRRVVKVAGRRRTQARHLKDKIQFTK
jgi:hypothetical protein